MMVASMDSQCREARLSGAAKRRFGFSVMRALRSARAFLPALATIMLLGVMAAPQPVHGQTAGSPVLSLVVTPASIPEDGSQSATVTARLSSAYPGTVTVRVRVRPGTGAASGDYTVSANKTLTIAEGATTSTGTVTITAEQNTVHHSTKIVTIDASNVNASCSSLANCPSLPALDDVEVNIIDDDPVTVSLMLDPASITENGGVSTVTARLSGPSSETTAVRVSAAAGTGASDSDFALSTFKVLVIRSNQTTSSSTVTITAQDNDVAGPDKTVTVSGNVIIGTLSDPDSVNLTITDDDGDGTVETPPTPSSDATLSALSVTDGSGSPQSLDQAFSSSRTVYTVSVANDVTSARVTATVSDSGATPAGSLSRAGAAAVPVDMTSGSAATLSNLAVGNNVLTITVTAEDDTERVYTLTVTRASATPTQSSDATLSGLLVTDGSGSPQSLDQAFSSSRTAYTVSVGNDVTSARVTATVSDSGATPAGSLSRAGAAAVPVDMTSGSAATLSNLAVGNNVLTITVTAEDSTAGTYTLTVARASPPHVVGEGPPAAVTRLRAWKLGDGTAQLQWRIPEHGGSRLTGFEGRYRAAGSTDPWMPANMETGPSLYQVGTWGYGRMHRLDRSQYEFQVRAHNALGAGPWSDTAAADLSTRPGRPVLAALVPGNSALTASWSVDDGGSPITQYELKWRERGPRKPWTTITESASDLTRAITGLTNGTQYIVRVRVHNAHGHSRWSLPKRAVPSESAPAALLLSLSRPTISENGGVVEVTASLSAAAASEQEVVVTVQAAPVSPATDSDYTMSTQLPSEYGNIADRSLIIPAGETTSSGVVTITAVNNDLDDEDKRVIVTGVSNGESSAPQTLTIVDDDVSGMRVSPDWVELSPGEWGRRALALAPGRTGTYTVAIDTEPAEPVTVTIQAGYSRPVSISPSSLTFDSSNWREPQPVAVTMTTDRADNATIHHTVSSADPKYDGYELRSVGAHVPDSFGISIADAHVQERAGAMLAFEVTLAEAATVQVTVDYETADVTAIGGVNPDDPADYTTKAGTVVFAVGETKKTINVAVTDDALHEWKETFTVTLSNPVGAEIFDGVAIGHIYDQDPAPFILIVSDEEVTEAAGASLVFEVRLEEAMVIPVTVDYATADHTAVAGEDYVAVSGSLRFEVGETLKTVEVEVLDDAHDEGSEQFTLRISNFLHVGNAKGVGIGTIHNTDPMPAAWLARFGRTVADHVLDGISARMQAPRTAGMMGNVGGQALALGSEGRQVSAFGPGSRHGSIFDIGRSGRASALLPGSGASDPAGFGTDAADDGGLTDRDWLLGSSFSFTGGADPNGGTLAVWGRGAHTQFDGQEDTLNLDGTVTTGMLGADYSRDRWTLGVALVRSVGDGGYADRGPGAMKGEIEASLTAAVPWAAVQASERIGLWGAAGFGNGEMTLKPDGGAAMETDLDWSMAAVGLRSELLSPPSDQEGGMALALVTDAMWAQTSSDASDGLVATESDASRVRVGLEGSWPVALADGGRFVPRLEIGARHDSGDAETGAGVDLGGGLAWSGSGFSLEVEGRTLIAAGEEDQEETGYAASFAFDPNPSTQKGLSLGLRQDWGARASGGLEALFAPDPLSGHGLAGYDAGAADDGQGRWTAEASYGFSALGGRFASGPHASVGLAPSSRDYSLGWWLRPESRNAPDLSVGLQAVRRQTLDGEADHRVGLELRARW